MQSFLNTRAQLEADRATGSGSQPDLGRHLEKLRWGMTLKDGRLSLAAQHLGLRQPRQPARRPRSPTRALLLTGAPDGAGSLPRFSHIPRVGFTASKGPSPPGQSLADAGELTAEQYAAILSFPRAVDRLGRAAGRQRSARFPGIATSLSVPSSAFFVYAVHERRCNKSADALRTFCVTRALQITERRELSICRVERDCARWQMLHRFSSMPLFKGSVGLPIAVRLTVSAGGTMITITFS